jgi:hypothetical protein
VPYFIAETGKPHTISEEVTRPAAKAIIPRVLEATQDCNSVSLSNTAVKQSIKHRADNAAASEKQQKQIFLHK